MNFDHVKLHGLPYEKTDDPASSPRVCDAGRATGTDALWRVHEYLSTQTGPGGTLEGKWRGDVELNLNNANMVSERGLPYENEIKAAVEKMPEIKLRKANRA